MRKYLLFVLVCPSVLFAEIRLTGVADLDGNGPRFVLEDTETKEKASWIPLGATFGQYTLSEYDPKAAMLKLRSGDEVVIVGLVAAVIQEPSPEPINRELFERAAVVVRAEAPRDFSGGRKYCWVTVKVIKTYKVPDGVALPSELSIAYGTVGAGLPRGEATLYLILYNPNQPEYGWKLLEGRDRTTGRPTPGYSHHSSEGKTAEPGATDNPDGAQ